MFDEYVNPYESHNTKKEILFHSNMKKTPYIRSQNLNDDRTINAIPTTGKSHMSIVNHGKPFSYIYPNHVDNRELPIKHDHFNASLKSRSRSHSDFTELLSNEQGKISVNSNPESHNDHSMVPVGTTVIVHVHQNTEPEREIWHMNHTYEHTNAGSSTYRTRVPHFQNKERELMISADNNSKNNLKKLHFPEQTPQFVHQRKYRDRQLSEKNIKLFDHLKKSPSCGDLIDHIHAVSGPKRYGNESPLKILRSDDRNFTKNINNSQNDIHSSKEHIYEEIDENQLQLAKSNSIKRSPPMLKKVTFLLPRDYMTREEDIKYKKKIIPVEFWGIAEVMVQLREKSEEYRRTVAHMCCNVVQLNYSSHSFQFLGKVDTSRRGEQMYLAIGQSSFEIRDNDGSVITNHRPTDVSVVVNNEKDPCMVTFIGKCKFMGRIAIVFKFNKRKHITLLNDFFRSNVMNNGQV